MKFINWLVDRYLIAGLMLASIVCGIAAIVQLGCAIFNFNPYYETSKKNGSWSSIGTNYKEGIPLTINVNSTNISDTSIRFVSGRTSGVYNHSSDLERMSLNKKDTLKRLDTIYGEYVLSYWNDSLGKKEQQVNNVSFSTFTVKVKPSSTMQRYLLLLPAIFFLFVLSYCFWQVAKFLHFIQLKDFFNFINYKRLRNIGVCLLVYQLIMFIFDLLFNKYNVSIQFNSTISNWRSPLYLSGSPQSNSSIMYFIIGCCFLIAAKAFKDGNQIKQEQDLTI